MFYDANMHLSYITMFYEFPFLATSTTHLSQLRPLISFFYIITLAMNPAIARCRLIAKTVVLVAVMSA
jgi:hypothetical protein